MAQTATIIGLGKIGGSLAAAYARTDGWRVLGIDANAGLERLACERGFAEHPPVTLEQAVMQADVVLLAVPVLEIVRIVPHVTPIMRNGAILLDTGGVKRPVVEAMRRSGTDVTCCGGHPIAGNEKSGADAWDADLLDRKSVV